MSFEPNPNTILCSSALKFSAKDNTTDKISHYTIIFKISLISKLPLEIPIICLLYKKTKDKKNPYKQIALKQFLVKQDKDSSVRDNNMYMGTFNDTKLPSSKDIIGFIKATLPNSTYSALTTSVGNNMCLCGYEGGNCVCPY